MKQKTLIMLLAAVFFLPSMAYSNLRYNVVNYYRSMPAELLENRKYDIEKDKSYTVTVSDGRHSVETVVDISNGYLKITDEDNKGEKTVQEIVLFITAEKQTVIGVKLEKSEGDSRKASLNFYSVRQNEWVNITENVLPRIDAGMFCDSRPDGDDLAVLEELAGSLDIIYSLPQYGTTASVALNTLRLGSGLLNDEGKAVSVKKAGRRLLDRITFRKIELEWSVKEGKFFIGKKKP